MVWLKPKSWRSRCWLWLDGNSEMSVTWPCVTCHVASPLSWSWLARLKCAYSGVKTMSGKIQIRTSDSQLWHNEPVVNFTAASNVFSIYLYISIFMLNNASHSRLTRPHHPQMKTSWRCVTLTLSTCCSWHTLDRMWQHYRCHHPVWCHWHWPVLTICPFAAHSAARPGL